MAMLLSQGRIEGSCFLLLSCLNFHYITEGAVALLPSPRAFVCNAGDRLEVMCNSTESFLQWRLTLLGMIDPTMLSISSTTVALQRSMINASIVVASRTSERGAVPLISTLVIGSVSDILNGTLNITCMDYGANVMATTTVYIAGSLVYPNSPLIDTEKEFGMNKVSVSLRWIQESLPVSYIVGIEPTIDATITMISNTQANLTLAYNTLYNVTVVADFCGYQATTIIEMNYDACGDILNELPDTDHQNNVSTTTVSGLGYGKPSLEGESVKFICPPKWVLTGLYSTTCTASGEWKPDPREVVCKANCTPPLAPAGAYIIPYTSTLEGTVVTYICHGAQNLHKETAICSNKGLWEPNSSKICVQSSVGILSGDGKIAVASSIIVFIMASVCFFTVGFLCRHQYPRREAKKAEISVSENLTLGPLYDNVLLNQHNSEVLELKENIAYGPIQQLNSNTHAN